MARRIHLLYVVLAVIFLPVFAEAVRLGDTPEAVQTELGSPNGTRTIGNRDIWVYSGDVTIEFEAGQLVRAKGMVLEVGEAVDEPSMDKVTKPSPEPTPLQEVGTVSEGSLSEDEQLVTELPDIEDARAMASQLQHDLGGDPADMPRSTTFLATTLDWTIPVFLQFIFLVIAFKWVGAEALGLVLLIIAIVDRLVVEGVQMVFSNVLEFPITFHADTLISVFVMLALITQLTHAKDLHTAIRVVIGTKVAEWIAFSLLTLFILNRL